MENLKNTGRITKEKKHSRVLYSRWVRTVSTVLQYKSL